MVRKTAFQKIENGLSEALLIARGEAKPLKLFITTTPRTENGWCYEQFVNQETVRPDDHDEHVFDYQMHVLNMGTNMGHENHPSENPDESNT